MQLTIGSNRLRSTDGMLRVRGQQQIALEWGTGKVEILLTMDLYSSGGGHIARLRRNQWTFNDHDRFEFAGNTDGFNLVDTKLSQVVLRARVAGKDSVVITQGVFCSSAGNEIEVTKEDWDGPEAASRTTKPPFAPDEVASIRRAVASSSGTIACPRCGSHLVRERLGNGAPRDGWLMSCLDCGRDLVVHGQSRAGDVSSEARG